MGEKRRDYLPGVAGSKKHEVKSAKELNVEALKDFDIKKASTTDSRAAIQDLRRMSAEADERKIEKARADLQAVSEGEIDNALGDLEEPEDITGEVEKLAA